MEENKGNLWTKEEDKLRYKEIAEKFKKGIIRDSKVREYCKNNSIILIEIPYTVRTTKEITRILMEIIINGKSPEDVINLSKFHNEIKTSLQIINKQENKEKDHEEI